LRSFDVTVRPEPGATVMVVRGTVDTVTAPQLTDAFQVQLQGGRHQLVADMAGVDYISSAGLRSVLAALKSARAAGGDLRLAAITPVVQQVFETAGFESIVRLFDDVDGALASFA